ALAGLVVTFAVLVKFVLPAVLLGKSPLLVAIVGSAAVMFVIMYLAHGLNALTTTALLGTLASLGIIAVLSAVFVGLSRLVNLGSEEALYLQATASQVDLRGLLLGGIIIGSLGVLNDVTVTQASAVWALRGTNPAATTRELYHSAMRIGRDHIASTVDTLVLAYAGASLPLLLLFTVASRPVGDVLTGELVAEEIVRTLVGSIGLVASVPITTWLAAAVASRVGAPRRAVRPPRSAGPGPAPGTA
ncbi:MAG: YibE/F family protein, partial [Actinobacteria bacterium]|nr:YibE/F family protein [Actinomycetota bacterium]